MCGGDGGGGWSWSITPDFFLCIDNFNTAFKTIYKERRLCVCRHAPQFCDKFITSSTLPAEL